MSSTGADAPCGAYRASGFPAILRRRVAVSASAGKNDSIASSETVTSAGSDGGDGGEEAQRASGVSKAHGHDDAPVAPDRGESSGGAVGLDLREQLRQPRVSRRQVMAE